MSLKSLTEPMASATQLLEIFDRIQNRIEVGCENFDVVTNLISRRADLAEKYSKLLKELIPEKIDMKDQLVCSIINDIKTESNMQNMLTQQLRNVIVTPSKITAQTQKTKRKDFEKVISKHKKKLEKACRAAQSAHNDLESEKQKLTSAPPQKKEAQQKKVAKARADFQQKSRIADELSANIQQNDIPTIHTNYGDFDRDRMMNMQKYCYNYCDLQKKLIEAQGEVLSKMLNNLQGFDSKDRSKRFVSGTFDPSKKGDEEELKYVVAIADYHSEEPTDLQFKRGDHITVLLQHSSGWWEGDINGRKGYFPESFVVFPGHPDIRPETIGAYFLVKEDFVSSRINELGLLSGDIVYVEVINRGICSGTNIRSGEKGTFPQSVLDISA